MKAGEFLLSMLALGLVITALLNVKQSIQESIFILLLAIFAELCAQHAGRIKP